MTNSDQTLVNPAAARFADEAEAAPKDELPAEPSEIERIYSAGGLVELVSEKNKGYKLVLQKMETRQFFRLLAILTSTVGPALVREVMSFEGGMTAAEASAFSQRLISLLLLAIPEAEDKSIAFIGSMFLPDGYQDVRPSTLSAEERTRNDDLMREMNDRLWNPPPEDTIELVYAIVRSEASDLVALGNRLARMFAVAIKSGQLEPAQSNGVAQA